MGPSNPGGNTQSGNLASQSAASFSGTCPLTFSGIAASKPQPSRAKLDLKSAGRLVEGARDSWARKMPRFAP
jgi:hypothetical protein